jgi:hypothetical protein
MSSGISDLPMEEVVLDGAKPNDGGVLQFIPTAPTQNAPAGRVVDDSARGISFWEIVSSEEISKAQGATMVTSSPSDSSTSSSSVAPEASSSAESPRQLSAWTRAFRIEWLSTRRVAFHQCRGLYNPWNFNREVKVARDGTEIEPTVGGQLMSLFFQASGDGNTISTP